MDDDLNYYSKLKSTFFSSSLVWKTTIYFSPFSLYCLRAVLLIKWSQEPTLTLCEAIAKVLYLAPDGSME